MKRRSFIFHCTLIVATLTSGCSSSEVSTRQPDETRAVDYVRIVSRPLGNGLTVSGRLVSREEAAVASQLSGFQVRQVLVDQGDLVKRGQPMATLDDTLLRADIAQQRANLVQAQVASERAGQEAERVASLDKTGVLSDEAIAERRLAARTAGAQLGSAQAQLTAQTVRQSLMVVRAPMSGRVLTRTVRPGDVASPSAIMFTIAAGQVVELDAEIPEQRLGLVHVGQGARVTLPSGAVVEGRVRLVSAQVDADTRLGRARVTLPVRSDLRPGGFAEVTFLGDGAPVLVLPDAAITYSADGTFVTTIGAQNRVKQVAVKVGRRASGMAEIVSGPPAGTRVLTGSQDFVLPGDKVQPVPLRPTPAQSEAK